MADPDDPAEVAARLEQALERIARLAQAPQPAAAGIDTGQIATRLDALIAELRAALIGAASA